MKKISLFLTSCLLLNLAQASQDDLIVATKSGKVSGKWSKSFEGNDFMSFFSIPYAKPPVGLLRFADPEPIEPWSDVHDGSREGRVCLQIPPQEEGVVGSEDCLWLSVFTPELKPDRARAVVVWIHGGRWLVGSARTSTYSPEYLMDRDVVVVTLQYRLGALGFLSTADSVAPGNYGLKDQVLALKWIKENIGSFGGDPDSITLVGHSAGGASVHGHIVSPMSKGLFNKVIAMSGTSNMGWAARYDNHAEVAKKQGEVLDCPTETSQELIACLRTVDSAKLTRAQSEMHEMFKKTRAKLMLSTFTPRIDKESDNPFFPQSPRDVLKAGNFDRSIPLMTGVTNQEGAWYAANLFSPNLKDRIDVINQVAPTRIMYLLSGPQGFSEKDFEKMHEFYFNGEKFSSSDHRIRASAFVSDTLFNYESLEAAHLHAKNGDADVFYYRFDYRGDWSYLNGYGDTTDDYAGVPHIDDVRYLMRLPWATPIYSDRDKLTMKRYTTWFTNFAKTANPNRGSDLNLPKWEKYGKNGQGSLLSIDSEEHTKNDRNSPFVRERMDVWRQIHGSESDPMDDWQHLFFQKREEL